MRNLGAVAAIAIIFLLNPRGSDGTCTFSHSDGEYLIEIFDVSVTNENDVIPFDCEHVTGYTDADVTFIFVWRSNLRYLQSAILDKFVNVRTMYILDSQLTTILDQAFNSCNELTDLYIDRNQITTIPTNAFRMCSKLRSLELTGNDIQSIEENMFEGAGNVEELNLSGNRISTVTATTFRLISSLKRLNLDGNGIIHIDSNAFAPLNGLETLSISNNLLTNLDSSWLQTKTNLTSLNLASNPFTSVDFDVLSNLTLLKSLDLSGLNSISLPSEAFHGMVGLEVLRLNEMGLNVVDRNLFTNNVHLTTLSLTSNDISSLDPTTFSTLTSLRSLNLAQNPLGTLDPSLLTGLSALTSLNLNDCGITSIQPNTFSNQQNLTSLSLSDNEIQVIGSEMFNGLLSLRTLALIGNNIIRLNSADFQAVSDVQWLQLSSNQIDEIERDFFTLFRNFNVSVLLFGNRCTGHSFTITQDFDFSTLPLEDCYNFWDSPRPTPAPTEPPTQPPTTEPPIDNNAAVTFFVSMPILLFTVMHALLQCCQDLIHLACYEIKKRPEEVFLSDNIIMVCDECLANRRENPSPKRKQPNSGANMVQTTLEVRNPMLSISKTTMAGSTPPKSKDNNQLQSVVEALVQKVENQTKTIGNLQTSIESMKGTVEGQTTAIGESSKINVENLSLIKESLNEISTASRKFSYADVAKGGVKKAMENGTPKSSWSQARAPRPPKPARTPKSTKPIITGTSTNVIRKPISPVRPRPEKAVWISGIHRDATEEELKDYIRDSIGVASADVDVRKLVKKGRDITEYRFVSFRIGCSSVDFNKLMNPIPVKKLGNAQQCRDGRMISNVESRAKVTRQAKITSFFSSKVGASSEVSGRVSGDVVIRRTTSESENFVNLDYFPLYYQNVRSIPARTDLRSRIKYSLYKGLCFTETRLHGDLDNECYFPQNFNVYRRDRDTFGGGVAILVHEQYKSYRIESIGDTVCECVCVKVQLRPCPLVIYLAYVNDSTRLDILLKHYELVRRVVAMESDCRVMVIGDFNLHDVVWNWDDSDTFLLPQDMASHTDSVYFHAASEFLRKMHDLSLFQLSDLKNISQNVLDLVFVNGTGDLHVCKAPVAITLNTEVDPFHVPIELAFESYPETNVHVLDDFIEVFSYKLANYENIIRQLGAINFAALFDRMDVDEAFDYFYELLNRVIVENVPKIRIRRNKNRPKWWTREWQQKKNKKKKMYKQKPKDILTLDYAKAVREFNELNERLNKEYIDQVQQNIVENPSEFWSYAKSKRKCATYPCEMMFGERKSENPQEVADIFADYFEGLYTKDEEPLVFDEEYGVEADDTWEVELTMGDIENAIEKLDPKSTSGPDDIAPLFVKKCMDALVWPLWILHQKSMELGKIPSKLKISKVVPVYKKKGRKDDVKNYRITAISSVVLKVYEYAIQLKLLDRINPNISNAQHGFRPRRSVETNLLNLSIVAHEALLRRKQLDIFYGDFKNAFDKLWHRIFIKKMKWFGIGKRTARWLFEFLVGRLFYVVIGDVKSRTYTATSGVPAGSILGPTLFLIGVNDIVECVSFALPLLFADDIKLLMEVGSSADSRQLQADIDNVLRWSERNRLPFNLEKCEVITIARINDPHYVTYFMGDHVVERKQEVRDLGIPVDVKFTLIAHMERSITRARQSMGFIKSVSKGQFGTRALVVLYNAYVRSKLEFASVIWDPYQQNYSNDIESVQKQFVMYALGDTNRIPPYRLEPYEERCKKIGLDKLSTRRKIANALMAYDLYNKRINDVNIEARFIRRQQHRSFRNERPLAEVLYERNYGYNQPMAKIIRLVNKYSGLMVLSRNEFKAKVKEKLKEDDEVVDDELLS
ncbi:uncharacterized protein LOC119081902 [Bradysia coprophila]|uniref:uncharacterized protein LOC119081902 n=1 Tax=Bradysia coprophila TaxID=38358 RepID=UPI00187DD6E1|nr:uncharacterized protein LOC119081902 [Bradysia coprophila]